MELTIICVVSTFASTDIGGIRPESTSEVLLWILFMLNCLNLNIQCNLWNHNYCCAITKIISCILLSAWSFSKSQHRKWEWFEPSIPTKPKPAPVSPAVPRHSHRKHIPGRKESYSESREWESFESGLNSAVRGPAQAGPWQWLGAQRHRAHVDIYNSWYHTTPQSSQ